MMHTINIVRQYLPAAFLIALGLTAHGCGDSVTVNPVAELSSLSVTTGTATAALQPGFSSATTNYTVQLSSGVTSVTVTARPAVEGDSVSINGQATTTRVIPLEPAGQTTVVQVVVSESGSNSRTYTVKLVRAGLGGNNSLQNLTVSPGELTPAFNADEQLYRVDKVDSAVTKVTVTATLDDQNATMTVAGQDTASGQGREIPLKPAGEITTIEIFVKAQNGQVKQYHIEVPRGKSGNNDLKSLIISTGTSNLISFSTSILDYTVNVANTVASVRVTPTLDDGTATMTINGTAVTSGQFQDISLRAAGQSTIITIRVTAQDGTQKTYTVEVFRAALGGNNKLRNLTLTPVPLPPPGFNSNTLNYTVNVGSSVPSVTVTPTLDDPTTASMTVNGQATNSGQTRTITLGPPDSNTFINIIVTAQNGSRNTYVVAVDKAPSNDNNLSALSVRSGKVAQTLSPPFTRSTTSYRVDVASDVDKVSVSATKSDLNATMAIDDKTFLPGTETGEKDVKLGGEGSETPVLITVTPQIGSPKTYSLTIRRLSSNNNLSALSVTAGGAAQALDPAFMADKTSYKVNVASNISTVDISASKSDPKAVMLIGALTFPSGTPSGQVPNIPLGGQDTDTPISITVTAQTGISKTYSVTVHRAALASDNKLSALSVTVEGKAQSLDVTANPPTYTVNVASTVTSVLVTATKSDPNAVMSGSVTAGTGVPTGQAPITLNGAGTDTPVRITVTAPNGSSNTYSITINRAASNNNNLSALSVTAGGVAQPLDVNAVPPSYTVSVATDVTQVTVSATKSDPNAVLSGSVADPGAGVATGQATIQLGEPLTTTPVTITVTAPDGTPKTYTIGVFRTFLLFQ